MDAREQLRRYLEQRRELGEQELVLDRLTVDEALKILGASGPAPGSATRERGVPPASVERAAPGARERGAELPADWREALRAAGASPEALAARMPADPAAVPPPVPAPPSRPREEPERPPTRAAEPPVSPPRKGTAASSAALADLGPAGLVVGDEGGALFRGELGDVDSLEGIAKLVAGCTKCPLYSTALNPVPGTGNSEADFMCVGEAPGQTEDEQGLPFVGAAGQLLTKILGAIDLKREDVFIANVLKHRPPGNRNPLPNEVTACSPYLIRQIELVQPKVILALGTFAAQTLLETKLSIGKLRGQIHRYHGVPLIVTYHPAALLRNPSWKRPTWEDVQLARRVLDRAADGA